MKQRARLVAFLGVMFGLTGAPGAGQNAPSPRPCRAVRAADADLQAQRRVRRGGRRRHRSRRPVRSRSRTGGLPDLRGRQAAGDLRVLHRRHPGRTAGAAVVRRRADRARRQEQRASVRRPHLRDGHRRSPHELRPHGARAVGGAAVHPAEPRRQRSDGGGPYGRSRRTRARSSPATSGCCSRPSIGLWAASSTRRP